MPCELGDKMSDARLLAYLDGEASAEVARHLEDCVGCQTRAQQLARLQGGLTARLYRAECPSAHELGEYHLRLLDRPRSRAVARHLAGCPHCAAEVAQLSGFLGPEVRAYPQAAGGRVRIWIAELIQKIDNAFPPPAPELAPAFVALRGGDGAPRLYRAGEAQIALEVQQDPEMPDLKALLGLVTGIDSSDMEAHLWRAAGPVASAPVDELGNFAFDGLPPGGYELILSGPAVEIHLQEIEV